MEQTEPDACENQELEERDPVMRPTRTASHGRGSAPLLSVLAVWRTDGARRLSVQPCLPDCSPDPTGGLPGSCGTVTPTLGVGTGPEEGGPWRL